MDALLHSNRVPEPHEVKIISSMINTEKESFNSLDTRIHQLEQDAEMARQRIQKLTTDLDAETRGLRLHEDAIAELQTTRNVLGQSIERKQAIMSSRRRIPGEIWRKIFLLLWGNEFSESHNGIRHIFPVALQIGAVCREWRHIAQTTKTLWSILDYTISPKGRVKSRRVKKLYHYLDHVSSADPYIILRNASSLLLPFAICKATTATDLVILMQHPDLLHRPPLTFPLSTPVFSQLSYLHICSFHHDIQIMSDSLRPFPSLVNLHLTNTGIHLLQPIIPHVNLKNLFIRGIWNVPHPWQSVTIDIAIIAEWFSNLTVLMLECDWQFIQQISTPQVVFRHVKRLYIRSSAISNVHGLTIRVSFPSLDVIANLGKNMNGLAPIVQAWGERVVGLVLSGLEPYDGFSQHLSEILGDSSKLPRLSFLIFRQIT